MLPVAHLLVPLLAIAPTVSRPVEPGVVAESDSASRAPDGAAPAASPAPSDAAASAAAVDAGVPYYWFWALSGLAVGAGIGGAIAGGMTLGDEDDYHVALQACRAGSALACADGPRIVADFTDHRLATNVLLFSAGGLAVAALVLAFFTDFDLPSSDDEPPPESAALPRLVLGAASGAALAWRF